MRIVLITLLLLLCFVPVMAQDTGVVQVGTHPTLGTILVAPNGMTLYTFANDQPGVSNCVGQCLELWPAYTVDVNAALTAGAGVPGTISVITQPDGLLHVTYDDAPLYFYSGDAAPGDANGQGIGNVWFAVGITVAAPPPPTSEFLLDIDVNRDLGSVLVASNGMTLYTFANDQPGVSNCVGECVNAWPPYTVDAAAQLTLAPGITGTISTLARPDGLTQTMLDNRPLYFFAGDEQPGDVNGQGVGNVWFSVPLDVVRLGGGPGRWYLVNSAGMTLYQFANDEPNWSNCIGDCIVNWPPLAFPAESPVISSIGIEGALATSLRADASYNVVFNGHPLYTFVNDAAPGDTNGDGAGGVWSIVQVAPVVQLGGNAALGTFAVDSGYRTLYVFANDQPGVSNCNGDCANNWPPLTLPAGVAPVALGYLPGTLSWIQRADGSSQVTLDGRPLYTFANDAAPGDANGNGAGGVWSVVPFNLPYEAPANCSVTPVNNTANLRQEPTVNSGSPRSVPNGEVIEIDGQAQSEGYIWWHLTTGEWVRSDVVSEVTPCAGVTVIEGVGVPAPPPAAAPASGGGQDVAPPAATPDVAPPPAPEPASTPEVSG